MVSSKMEYASSAWMKNPPTSFSKLDGIQRRALQIIGVSEVNENSHQLQQLSQRRPVGAMAIFHWVFHCEAPEFLQHLLPNQAKLNIRLRQSVWHHELAVKIPRFNLVSHQRSFLPSSAQLRNALPGTITADKNRLSFQREVNCCVDANPLALP